jgi:acyl-CoA thioesterase FadM
MITKASVRYKSEAFYGDLLAVTIALASQATRTFGLAYEVKNNRSGKVVAVAETEQIFYDFEKKRVASTPERFRTFIERSCQNACMKIPNVEI